jgi:hypothetical protein
MPSTSALPSRWDHLVPDLQRHIHGLAVEQHSRELMKTHICPSIILAGLKRNQAEYEVVEQELSTLYGILEHRGRFNELMIRYEQLQDEFDTKSFRDSIASLARAERIMWNIRLHIRLHHAGDRGTQGTVCGVPGGHQV